jgi:hypothetical protein
MDEAPNGHAHENEDSGSLNDRTKIEMLTAKRATYSVEEQHTIQKEALWRKRWEACREGLMEKRERRAESTENLRGAEQIPSQHKSYPDPRGLNMKWSMCMTAIMVLGGLAVLNSRAVFGWGGQRHKATNRQAEQASPRKSNSKSRLT